MSEINLGQITSLTYCKECGCPNQIGVTQEKIKCKACGKEINLKVMFGIDMVADHEENK